MAEAEEPAAVRWTARKQQQQRQWNHWWSSPNGTGGTGGDQAVSGKTFDTGGGGGGGGWTGGGGGGAKQLHYLKRRCRSRRSNFVLGNHDQRRVRDDSWETRQFHRARRAGNRRLSVDIG